MIACYLALILASVWAIVFYVLFHFAVITSVLAQAAGLMFEIYTIYETCMHIYIYIYAIYSYIYILFSHPDQTQIKD